MPKTRVPLFLVERYSFRTLFSVQRDQAGTVTAFELSQLIAVHHLPEALVPTLIIVNVWVFDGTH